MNTAGKIFRYQLRAAVRSRWVLLYAGFFFAAAEGLLRFGGDSAKAAVSLLNIVLMLLPLVSILFGTTYLYNARDFVEMLLAQPVRRLSLFTGLYAGLTVPLMAAFVIGVGVPFVTHSFTSSTPSSGIDASALTILLFAGVALTAIFTAFAFLIASLCEDKALGMGVALVVWLLLGILYDAGILAIVWTFHDYPLETPVLAMSIANPIDLARILVMLKFDIAALMGYTGAVFEKFFGTGFGLALSASSLFLWIVLPFWAGIKVFIRKDF